MSCVLPPSGLTLHVVVSRAFALLHLIFSLCLRVQLDPTLKGIDAMKFEASIDAIDAGPHNASFHTLRHVLNAGATSINL